MNRTHFEFSEINFAKYNPRVALKPADKEYQDIRKSLEDFGFLGGAVVNTRTMTLVGGHQRVNIMSDMGKTGAEFATVDLDPIAEKRLNLILNKVSGRWNVPDLTELLRELQQSDITLEGLGFSPVELNALLTGTPKRTRRDPDDAPAAPDDDKATTKPGDLFEIKTPTNAHRLLCGDCTKDDDVAKLCGPHKPRVVFLDPPYGVSYVSKAKRRRHRNIDNDDLRDVGLCDFLTAAFTTAANVAIKKAAFYTFYASRNHIEFETAMTQAGWLVKEQLIWGKQMVLGRSDYHWAHEPILYGCRIGENCEWFGDRTATTLLQRDEQEIKKISKDDAIAALLALKNQTTLWDERRDPPSSYIHPTQKPVSLPGRAIRNSSMPKDHILDSFGGSGSTLIACEMHDRNSLTLEQSRGHCDAILRRIFETFEGVTITRNGKKFTRNLVHAE